MAVTNEPVPLRVAELLPLKAFTSYPLRRPSNSRTPDRKPTQSQSDQVDFSKIPITVQPWDGFEVLAKDVELHHDAPFISLQDPRSLDLDTFTANWHIRSCNGAHAGDNERNWRASISGKLLFTAFRYIAAAMDCVWTEENVSTSNAASSGQQLEPSQPQRKPAPPSASWRPQRHNATQFVPDAEQGQKSPRYSIEELLGIAIGIKLIPDAECLSACQDDPSSMPLLCLELKHSTTIGLHIDARDPENTLENARKIKDLVEDALHKFPEDSGTIKVYGPLRQVLTQMLVRGASVGILLDGAIYVFLRLRSSMSASGQRASNEDHDSGNWTLRYYVAEYNDELPSVFQCFAYALKCAQDRQNKQSDSWQFMHRLLLARPDSTGQEQSADAPEQSADAQEPGAVGDCGSPSEQGISAHSKTKRCQRSCGRTLYLEPLLGSLVGQGRYAQVWRYGEDKVIKCIKRSWPEARTCMEREVAAYMHAKELQGRYLPKLHEFGDVGQVVSAVVLDFVAAQHMKDGVKDAADDIWEAFAALWRVGLLHGDAHAGNIFLQPSEKPGKRYEVKIVDLGHATIFDGSVPVEHQTAERARLSQLVGQPTC